MWDLATSEFKRSGVLMLRYPVEFVIGTGLMTALFYGIVFGAKVIGGDHLDSGMRELVVGYLLWLLAAGWIGGIPSDVQCEIRQGNLENLFLSQYSISTILLARAVSSFIQSILSVGVIASIIILLSDVKLHFHPVLVLHVFSIFLTSAGLGMLLAGVTLMIKRVQFLLIAIQGLLFPLAFVSVHDTALAGERAIGWMLPLVSSFSAAKEVTVSGAVGDTTQVVLSVINAVCYFCLGWAGFGVLRRWTEQTGLVRAR